MWCHQQTDDVNVEVCDVTSGCVVGDARVSTSVVAGGRPNNERSRQSVDQQRLARVGSQRSVDEPCDRRRWTSGLDATCESQAVSFDHRDITADFFDIWTDCKRHMQHARSMFHRQYCVRLLLYVLHVCCALCFHLSLFLLRVIMHWHAVCAFGTHYLLLSSLIWPARMGRQACVYSLQVFTLRDFRDASP